MAARVLKLPRLGKLSALSTINPLTGGTSRVVYKEAIVNCCTANRKHVNYRLQVPQDLKVPGIGGQHPVATLLNQLPRLRRHRLVKAEVLRRAGRRNSRARGFEKNCSRKVRGRKVL